MSLYTLHSFNRLPSARVPCCSGIESTIYSIALMHKLGVLLDSVLEGVVFHCPVEGWKGHFDWARGSCTLDYECLGQFYHSEVFGRCIEDVVNFLERLHDNSECLAARGDRSLPKSIVPALGKSLSPRSVLSGLIAPNTFFLWVVVVMWLAEPSRHKVCCKVLSSWSLDTCFLRFAARWFCFFYSDKVWVWLLRNGVEMQNFVQM